MDYSIFSEAVQIVGRRLKKVPGKAKMPHPGAIQCHFGLFAGGYGDFI